MTERETLKKWLDESSNIVFFGGPVCPRRAIFRISGVQTDCTTRNTIIRRRRSSAIPSI